MTVLTSTTLENFSNWVDNNLEEDLTASETTQELYTNYENYVFNIKGTIPLSKKTFVTLLKRHYRTSIEEGRIVSVSRGGPRLIGLRLNKDQKSNEQMCLEHVSVEIANK